MRQIKFTISKESKVTISVEGACGESCIDLTRPYEQAIGEAETDTPTQDMYEQEATTEKENQ